MKRFELGDGVERIVLQPEDEECFGPVAFTDAAGTFLTQTGFSCAERPVYRLDPSAGEGDVRQTAH